MKQKRVLVLALALTTFLGFAEAKDFEVLRHAKEVFSHKPNIKGRYQSLQGFAIPLVKGKRAKGALKIGKAVLRTRTKVGTTLLKGAVNVIKKHKTR